MESTCEIVAYHQEFRTALFISGFTMGSFLFSMKSVIIKTMKEDYYDLSQYQDAVKQRRGKGQKIGYYSQLKNFSNWLVLSIVFSFLSALSQISIGYSNNTYLISICLFLAVLSWLFVAISIFLVSRNWSMALDMAESKAIEKNEK